MTSTENVGRLETETNKRILWHVTGVFDEELEKWEVWRSPVFHEFGATWYLKLYPKYKRNYKTVAYVEFYLRKKKALSKTPRLRCMLSLKKIDGTIYRREKGKRYDDEEWGWKNFIQRGTLLRNKDKLTSNDELTFHLEIDRRTDYIADSLPNTFVLGDAACSCGRNMETENISRSNDVNHFMKNIADMFFEQRNFDVIFKVKGAEYKAHKFILTARSPVFESMFEHDMMENGSGVVSIEDCDPFAFKDFLQYLYMARTGILTFEKVLDLFFIADKYNVSSLRDKCVEFILENLSIETFCKVYTVALKHNEPELIEEAEEFFFENVKNVLISADWQLFIKENSTAANELFIRYSEQE